MYLNQCIRAAAAVMVTEDTALKEGGTHVCTIILPPKQELANVVRAQNFTRLAKNPRYQLREQRRLEESDAHIYHFVLFL